MIGRSQRPVRDNTQQSQETDSHGTVGFEPAIPSKRADAYLSSCDHPIRLSDMLVNVNASLWLHLNNWTTHYLNLQTFLLLVQLGGQDAKFPSFLLHFTPAAGRLGSRACLIVVRNRNKSCSFQELNPSPYVTVPVVPTKLMRLQIHIHV